MFRPISKFKKISTQTQKIVSQNYLFKNLEMIAWILYLTAINYILYSIMKTKKESVYIEEVRFISHIN